MQKPGTVTELWGALQSRLHTYAEAEPVVMKFYEKRAPLPGPSVVPPSELPVRVAHAWAMLKAVVRAIDSVHHGNFDTEMTPPGWTLESYLQHLADWGRQQHPCQYMATARALALVAIATRTHQTRLIAVLTSDERQALTSEVVAAAQTIREMFFQEEGVGACPADRGQRHRQPCRGVGSQLDWLAGYVGGRGKNLNLSSLFFSCRSHHRHPAFTEPASL